MICCPITVMRDQKSEIGSFNTREFCRNWGKYGLLSKSPLDSPVSFVHPLYINLLDVCHIFHHKSISWLSPWSTYLVIYLQGLSRWSNYHSGLRLANFRAGNKIRIGFSCEISSIQMSLCGRCAFAVQIVEPEDILTFTEIICASTLLDTLWVLYMWVLYEAELHIPCSCDIISLKKKKQ